MLEKINKEIQECPYCPFIEYEFNKVRELGFGEKGKIMFIGLAPAISSNRSQGQSRFDFFFENLLKQVGIKRSDYYFTNLCKTAQPRDIILDEEQIEHCKGHLMQEILEVDPILIVFLGKVVREAFFVMWPEYLVRRRIDTRSKSKFFKCFALAHPAMLHYRPELKEKYLKALNKINEVYTGLLNKI